VSRRGWHARLSNGLDVIGEHLPGAGLVALRLRVSAGARHEGLHEQGAAHFLEHTTVQASNGKLHTAFNMLGAELHANTSPDETCYFVYVLSDYAPQALTLLSNMLAPPLEKTCVAERHVILQEIERAYDTPVVALYKRVLATLFPDHPIGADVLGTTASLAALSCSNLMDFWRRRYSPKHMTLAIIGGWSPEMASSVTEACSWPNSNRDGEVKDTLPQAQPLVRWVHKPALTQQYLGMGIAGPGLDIGLASYSLPILATVLTGRLNACLRRLGVPAQASAFYVPFDDCGFMFVMLVAPPSGASVGLQALKMVLKTLSAGHVQDDEWSSARTQLAVRLALEAESFTLSARNLIKRWRIARRPMTSTEEMAYVLALQDKDAFEILGQLGPTCCAVTLGSLAEEGLPELTSLIEASEQVFNSRPMSRTANEQK